MKVRADGFALLLGVGHARKAPRKQRFGIATTSGIL
jgi:hypothetical protein